MIFFLPITARLFSRAAPFSAFSIPTILLDKCQMKSFESISILIKVKTFLVEKPYFWKSFYLKKNMFLEIKKGFEKKKIKTTVFLKKKLLFEIIFFLIFFF